MLTFATVLVGINEILIRKSDNLLTKFDASPVYQEQVTLEKPAAHKEARKIATKKKH